MTYKLLCILIISSILCVGCQEGSKPNAAANTTATEERKIDRKVKEIVDKTMLAMGGESKWNNLKHISWTFFGARHLFWDKAGHTVRIEQPKDSSIFIVNLETLEGIAVQHGVKVTDPEQLSSLMQRAKSIWINDMYWLFMPFKLMDTGVSLGYSRTDTLNSGQIADVLTMTFEKVGDTPNNKYEVYIDQSDHLIKKWDFYSDRKQQDPSKSWPWDNYKSYDGLLLSAERSDDSGPSDVRIYDSLPEGIFTSLTPHAFSAN